MRIHLGDPNGLFLLAPIVEMFEVVVDQSPSPQFQPRQAKRICNIAYAASEAIGPLNQNQPKMRRHANGRKMLAAGKARLVSSRSLPNSTSEHWEKTLVGRGKITGKAAVSPERETTFRGDMTDRMRRELTVLD